MSSVYNALKKLQEGGRRPDDGPTPGRFAAVVVPPETGVKPASGAKKGLRLILFGLGGICTLSALAATGYHSLMSRETAMAVPPAILPGQGLESMAAAPHPPLTSSPPPSAPAATSLPLPVSPAAGKAREDTGQPEAKDSVAVVLNVATDGKGQEPSTGPRYPEASTRLLSAADIAGKSLAELKLMRNEIYARHSYIFNSGPLRDHFLKEKWYVAKHPDVSAMLTEIEQANIRFIKSREPEAFGKPKKK